MMHTQESKTRKPERKNEDKKINVFNEYKLEKSMGVFKKSDKKMEKFSNPRIL